MAMSDVTRILSQIEHGDPHATDELLPLVYNELRKLAAARLSREKMGQTLSATSLVHEAYLRLVGGDQTIQWSSRGHFFAAAAEAIRRILVEHARAKRTTKRGGEHKRIDFENVDLAQTPSCQQLLDFNDALQALELEDPDAGRLVRLRYFAGLSVEECAQVMGVGRSTAYDHWTFARAWLRCKLSEGP
jgi:RNA polymerase sigma factor (TIGR02999 family)